MTDLHFRATTQRAFATMAGTLGLGGPGVSIDRIAPGSIVQTKDVLDPNWHFNVRLDDSFDGTQIKKNFGRLAGATRKSVDSTRRTGMTHSWDSVTNANGEVWLIDPPPITPARIWLGDAAPPVSR